ncbi:MAG: GYD domain-containing protein [Thermoplasmata archaeon]
MPTYIVLAHLTHQAKRNRSESLKMRDKLWDEYRKKGLKFTAYDTLGPYDVVTIVEAPSEELAMKYLGAAGESGNLETTTLRAFTADEVQRIRNA